MPQRRSLRDGDAKLPKGEAKGRIVPIRFNAADIKRIESSARASRQTVSEWIRSAITTVMERAIGNGFQIRTIPVSELRLFGHNQLPSPLRV